MQEFRVDLGTKNVIVKADIYNWYSDYIQFRLDGRTIITFNPRYVVSISVEQ